MRRRLAQPAPRAVELHRMTATRPREHHGPRLTPGAQALGLALAALLSGGLLATPGRAAAATVPASQALVTLTRDHVARTRPSSRAHRLKVVAARRPLSRVRTVLPVLGYATTAGSRWVHVRLPGRPNSETGWIPAARTVPAATGWRLAIDLSERRVTAYHDGATARRFRAVVGKPSTPTPRGDFFIEEVIRTPAGEVGGPFGLATSARSNVFQEFGGGPGQIGIHGTTGLSGGLGSAVSHGCVRLSPSAITWLAKRIGSGVPLTVTG
jgi:lipoprotein-anchoring transpeptidase ErfK/SrfK